MTSRYDALLTSIQARDQATLLLGLFALAFVIAWSLMRTAAQRVALAAFYIVFWVILLVYYGFML